MKNTLPPPRRTIFINGKFLAQRTTGVQRLAMNLTIALDQLPEIKSNDFILLCPPGSNSINLKNIKTKIIGLSNKKLHLWEQIILPFHTRGQFLLNLAGPAPFIKKKQVCMIPDAAVYDFPKAYTRSFKIWYQILFRKIISEAFMILTISEFSKIRLIKNHGKKAERLKIVPCGADHIKNIESDFEIIGKYQLNDKKFFLSVGSFNPSKNLLNLVIAFSKIKNSNAYLVLAGDKNNAIFSNEEAQFFNHPRIIKTGPITDEQLSGLYAMAHAFIFPSLYEGFGIPPLEAMSLGCPVFVANAASMPEVCGNAAEYFNPHSIEDITATLEKSLANEIQRHQLREQGYQRVKQYTWHKAAQKLISHLKDEKII